jgi:hypothetical protein
MIRYRRKNIYLIGNWKGGQPKTHVILSFNRKSSDHIESPSSLFVGGKSNNLREDKVGSYKVVITKTGLCLLLMRTPSSEQVYPDSSSISFYSTCR